MLAARGTIGSPAGSFSHAPVHPHHRLSVPGLWRTAACHRWTVPSWGGFAQKHAGSRELPRTLPHALAAHTAMWTGAAEPAPPTPAGLEPQSSDDIASAHRDRRHQVRTDRSCGDSRRCSHRTRALHVKLPKRGFDTFQC